MKTLKDIVLITLIIIVIGVLTIGYLGFIPILSQIFGSDKPNDMGIYYDKNHLKKAVEKTRITYRALPSSTSLEKSLQFQNPIRVDTDFSDHEITALANTQPWRYFPFTKLQIKFDDDNYVRISGIILKDKINDCLVAIDVPNEARQYIAKFIKFLPQRMPFYIVGKAAMDENRLSIFEVESLKLGRLNIPVSSINKYRPQIVNFIQESLTLIDGFYAKYAHPLDGQLKFEGNLPALQLSVQ